METEETLVALSHVRLGVNLKRVKDIEINKVNELFLLTQEAHLQRILGKKLEGDARKAARAEFIRQRLSAD
jgi:protein arginine kinase